MTIKEATEDNYICIKYYCGIENYKKRKLCGETIIPINRISSVSKFQNYVLIGNDVFKLYCKSKHFDNLTDAIFRTIMFGVIENVTRHLNLLVDNTSDFTICDMVMEDNELGFFTIEYGEVKEMEETSND